LEWRAILQPFGVTMSASSDQKRKPSDNYRKPPVEHQFKKGQSGNPKGRPKKKTQRLDSGLGGGIVDQFGVIALTEAMRVIAVREGDKITKMPAIQALLRSMFRSATQGDAKAQRQLLEIVAQKESARVDYTREVLEGAFRYKQEIGAIFARHERDGLPPPDIYPHPDDIIIKEKTGAVLFDGPTSKEEAGAQKIVMGETMKNIGRFYELEKALSQDPSNRELQQEFMQLKKVALFYERNAGRRARREAIRRARRALEVDSTKTGGRTAPGKEKP
jgi:Family of unknown function (DUF5681)